ncbi:20431_t:CDS:2, partial [Gigaspora rosea]
ECTSLVWSGPGPSKTVTNRIFGPSSVYSQSLNVLEGLRISSCTCWEQIIGVGQEVFWSLALAVDVVWQL